MEATQKNAETKPVTLMRFYSEQDKTAWLDGRKGRVEPWEQACVDVGLMPPATQGEFRAAVDCHPELKAFLRAKLEKMVRAQIEASGAPAVLVEKAITDAIAGMEDKLADVAFAKVSVKRLELSPEEGFLMQLLADDSVSPDKIIEMVRELMKMERRLERVACAKLIMAVDAVGGERFAEAIRLRDAAENPDDACECEKCAAVRSEAEVQQAPQAQ